MVPASEESYPCCRSSACTSHCSLLMSSLCSLKSLNSSWISDWFLTAIGVSAEEPTTDLPTLNPKPPRMVVTAVKIAIQELSPSFGSGGFSVSDIHLDL